MIYPGCPVAFGTDVSRMCKGASLVRYAAADGVKLEGAFARSGKADAPVALFFHGNGESAAQNLSFAQELNDQGIDVFLAEYRGYGGLEGEPTEKGLYLDGAAALEQIRKSGVPPERVVLVGRSLGSGIATELASRGNGSALVLISPYTSMVDMGRSIAGPLAAILIPDKYENESKIAKLDLPVIVIHGDRDEVVPYAMGKTLAKRAKHGRLVTAAGFGHNDLRGLGEIIARELAAK